jgi:hypothetical protein
MPWCSAEDARHARRSDGALVICLFFFFFLRAALINTFFFEFFPVALVTLFSSKDGALASAKADG